MTKGAKTAAGAAVVVGLGLAGYLTYKHFSKGTAPAGLSSSGKASQPAGGNATGPASIAIAGIAALPGTINALDGVFNGGNNQ